MRMASLAATTIFFSTALNFLMTAACSAIVFQLPLEEAQPQRVSRNRKARYTGLTASGKVKDPVGNV